MIEQTNEIVRRFNRIYNTDCLKETKPILSKTPRLVGIDGQSKASKSLGNAIFLSDTPEEIKRKVFLMFTDPTHLKISDPGKVEGNVVFEYLDAFHLNSQEVSDLKVHYRKGGLGDSTIKNILNTTLQTMLEPIREKRNSFKHGEVMDIIISGTAAAKKVTEKTLEEVRSAIGLRYFD